MFSIVRRRLTTGIATSRYPAVAEVPPPAFRGMPELVEMACRGDGACSDVCPTAAINVASVRDGWTWRLDRAACIDYPNARRLLLRHLKIAFAHTLVKL